MKRWLLLMTKTNLAKCESGDKTNTRRDNERYAKIKKGDHIYFRSDYKTTYKTASGPYIATADARWEVLMDISEADAIAEGCPGGKKEFMGLWDSIYKREGVRWSDNPDVIRIEFKRIKP